MASYSEKELEITVVLGKGAFGGEGNTKMIKGLAAKCVIEKVHLPDKNKAKVQIYGVKLEDMEQMTTLAFLPLETQKNYVQAGEKGQELALAFKGEITTAYANFNTAPDIAFELEAMTGYFPSLTAIPATSANGSVSLDSLLSKLAGQAEYTFINKGVTGSVVNPYLVGSPFEQIRQLAGDNDFDVLLDDEKVIALPKEKARDGNTVKLSASTGLIGYPRFSSSGISVKCLYEKNLQIGGLVEIESLVPKASGIWKITKLSHTLSAHFPGENVWESSIEAVLYK